MAAWLNAFQTFKLLKALDNEPSIKSSFSASFFKGISLLVCFEKQRNRKRERKRERASLTPWLVHSQVSTLRSESSIKFSKLSGNDPILCNIICCLPGCTLEISWSCLRGLQQGADTGLQTRDFSQDVCFPQSVSTSAPNTCPWMLAF